MKKSIYRQWFAVLLLFSALVWWTSVSIREAAAMCKGKAPLLLIQPISKP
jgi:hypothetical protein